MKKAEEQKAKLVKERQRQEEEKKRYCKKIKNLIYSGNRLRSTVNTSGLRKYVDVNRS